MNNEWIMTRTGKHFTPFNPKIKDIDIEDIAHALANLCRFNGHTSKFYSVAEHSILVSVLCPKELKLKGLLHDAAEAYLGDIPTPLKTKEQMTVEITLLTHIFEKFGVVAPVTDPVVKQADERILFWEALELGMNPFGWDWTPDGGGESLTHLIQCIKPNVAKDLFLAHFHHLTHPR